MPTYVYETIPEDSSAQPEQFEIRQSMNDKPLKRHPETGVAVRRLITGGFGYMSSGAEAPMPSGGG